MSLKSSVRDKIMNEVILQVKSKDFKVLLVDKLGMRIMSASCKMHEIVLEQIALVEDINKVRQSLPSLDAIYLISPTERSVRALMNDFSNPMNVMYNAAHVFFTEACPEELFNRLCNSNCARYIKTLREINVSFIPNESKVFSLDSVNTFQFYYNPNKQSGRMLNLERCAEQIATLCATLGEYPSIRYRSELDKNAELAKLVQQKLNAHKSTYQTMGEGPGKDRSQLIILDRGFDPVSPLLHELTFQAMAYDLLNIENDVYKCDSEEGNEIILDDEEEIWAALRHLHIADVSHQITKKVTEMVDQKKMMINKEESMKELSQVVKTLPKFQKDKKSYSNLFVLAEKCVNGSADKLCTIEQNLAMGTDAEGEKIKDPLKNIGPILFDPEISASDKIRVILLYIIHKGGVTEEILNKLFEHARIPIDEKEIMINMQKLFIPVTPEGGKKVPLSFQVQNRKEREYMYEMSRWTPYIKDIMEDAIEEKLQSHKFPLLLTDSKSMDNNATPQKGHYGQWHKDRNSLTLKNVPRLIVFVVGGISYSEMRCAYEVSQSTKNWDVIIGSTNIITPNGYLSSLRNVND